MMDDLSTIWNEHLRLTSAAKHRIDLTEPRKLINQNPYCAGPRHRELEKTKADKLLSEEVIEPANTEWASPTVFAAKKV